jgi:peptidoglycan hydrolase CwlO-like protein
MTKKKTAAKYVLTLAFGLTIAFSLTLVFPLNIYANNNLVNDPGVVSIIDQKVVDNTFALVQTLKQDLAIISNLTNRIPALNNQVQSLTAQITTLQGQNTQLQNQNTQYQDTIQNLTNQLNTAKAQVSSLQTQVSQLQIQVSQLQTQLRYAYVIVTGTVTTNGGAPPYEIQINTTAFTVSAYLFSEGSYRVVLPNNQTYTITVYYYFASVSQASCNPLQWPLSVQQTTYVKNFSC